MNKIDLKEKILNLETELQLLKERLFKKPDFKIDEKNWKIVISEAKKIRKRLYKNYYGKMKIYG